MSDAAADSATELPGAATRRVRDLLAGLVSHGTVLHTGTDAVYVEVGGRCLGVLSRHAVHVPCGIRTIVASLPVVDRAATVVAGDGSLTIDSLRVKVTRIVQTVVEVRAHRPRELRHGSQDSWRALLTPQPPINELPSRALADLRAGDPGAVPALLGRGSGLTPLGDDVLCGWLATSRMLDDPARPAVATEALRLAPARTTRLSAELVECAVAGETIPEFRRLLTALVAGVGVGPALADLLRVGHTSGAGLALGCRLSLERAMDRRAAA